ncbi:MAG: FAD-dependent oxidoreductase [Bacillota bacterium]|nr:FAD-dependent oxidoreductase [Bacillota bacterium]
MKHLIIGNSAAGVAAAETIRQQDPKCSITIISNEEKPYYSRCRLADYITGEIQIDKMLVKNLDFYRQQDITLLSGQLVTAVSPEEQTVTLASGKKLEFDRLLIATGASNFFPPVPGISSEGVYGLRTLADADRIRAACSGAKNVVVIGGGLVGLEAAEALLDQGLKVTVVEKINQLLPIQLDEAAANIVTAALMEKGMRIITGTGFTAINKTSWLGKLFGKPKLTVSLENGEVLPADFVIVATGTRPNTSIVRETSIEVNRGILVNQQMETNIEGIFAAGDVAESVDAVTGEIGVTPIWPNAVRQGKLAGLNMAGKKINGEPLIAMQNSLTLGGIDIISLGLVNPPKGSDHRIMVGANRDGSYKKLVLQGNVLQGVVLVGKVEQAGVYGALIKSRKPLTQSMAALMEDSFGYGKLLSNLPNKAG